MEEEAEEAWLVTTMPDGQRRDTSFELVILRRINSNEAGPDLFLRYTHSIFTPTTDKELRSSCSPGAYRIYCQ